MIAKFIHFKSKLTQTDRGASMVEYALLVILIAICGFVAVSQFGDSVSGTYGSIADNLQQAGS
jgi:Flp pilus assembly pilin Flp